MVTAIIFDCDGTLIKSLDLGLDSYNYALEKLGEPPRAPEEIKQYFGAGADRIFMKLLGDESKALKAFDYFFEHESEQVEKIKLHDGIIDLLEELSSRKIPMAVVTGRHQRDLEMIFTHHKLHRYFKTLICDNHLPFSKPAPDGILLACRHLGVSPENTLYIGDSVMDIEAAHRAGSKSIAALWDTWVKPHDMKNENPFAEAHTPSDILSFL